jgi:hypothetical protein
MKFTKLSTVIILSIVVLSCFVTLYHMEPATATTKQADFIFHETGLASGTSWTVNFYGANRTSTNNLISVLGCYEGSYSWIIYVPSGYNSSSPLTGSYYVTERETINVYVNFTSLTSNYTLTMETVGQGSVYPGNQTYPSGTSVNLTAVPAEGWTFSGWSGNASISSNTTITMDSNKTIIATFVRSYYNLTAEIYLNDNLQNTTTYIYAAGSTENVTADFLGLLASQTLEHWDLDGTTGYNSSITVLMDQDHTFKAYTISTAYQLDITSTSGGITSLENGSYTYLYGANAELTASPNAGYSFAYWLVDNATAGSNTTLSLTIYANHTITAIFTQTTIIATKTTDNQTYTITVNSNNTTSQTSNMTITPHQSNSSTTVSFTITGESGTVGFFNLTIPKAAIPYGLAPILYIEGVKAENQTYTEDNENYYISYTVHFSTHEIKIAFTTETNSSSNSSSSSSTTTTTHTSATPTSTPTATPTSQPTTNPTTTPTATTTPTTADLSIWLYLAIAIIAFVMLFAGLSYRRKKHY